VVGAPQPADLAQEVATNVREVATSLKVAQAVPQMAKKMIRTGGDCQALKGHAMSVASKR